jgi:dipeptide transport system permease protein
MRRSVVKMGREEKMKLKVPKVPFITSLVAGILIIVGGILGLLGFTMLGSIAQISTTLLALSVLELICGIIIFVMAFMLYVFSRYAFYFGIVTIVFSVISLFFFSNGFFLIGFILGAVGGSLAISMRLLKYILIRVSILGLTLITLTLLVFAVTQFFTPEQRALLFITDPRQMRSIPTIIKQYNLDESAFIQFPIWMTEVLQGNLGWSRTSNKGVLTTLLSKFPATLEIVMFSIPITLLVVIFLGVLSSYVKPIDHIIKSLSMAGYALPTFCLGIMLFTLFVGTGWFPLGRLSANADNFAHSKGWITYTGMYTIDGLLNGQPWITAVALQHLVLPVTVLTISSTAAIMTIIRSNMFKMLKEKYAAARMRRALFLAINPLGILFASTLASIIIIEAVFNFDGLGRWAANSAIQLDIPPVIYFVLVSGFIFVIASFIVDIVCTCIDARIGKGL